MVASKSKVVKTIKGKAPSVEKKKVVATKVIKEPAKKGVEKTKVVKVEEQKIEVAHTSESTIIETPKVGDSIQEVSSESPQTTDHSQKTPEEPPKPLFLVPPVASVKEFSDLIHIPATKVIMQLIQDGFMVNINESIDFDVMSLVGEELGIRIELDTAAATLQSMVSVDLGVLLAEDKKGGVTRSPIVSVMGHVDHGKTSLLDTIRKSNVVDKEAGSITQSIGAYQVHVHDRDITFIDTPGHEAFIAMRKRGVQSTDIAILAIASNEGVKSQTKEAISHAKEAKIPIIVAITKKDLPDANIDKVKTELSEIGLVPEEWGGDVMMIPVSKHDIESINKLLDAVLLQADIMDLKADPKRPAIGTVIESNFDAKLGKIATILIHTGSLSVRDTFVIGSTFGRVKNLLNDRRKTVEKAGPAMPVMITGLNDLPHVGDVLQVVANEHEAKKLSDTIAEKRGTSGKSASDIGLELLSTSKEGDAMKGICIVLKADTIGSLEAIKDSLGKIKTENAKIKIVRGRTGNISQSDVLLANATDSDLVAFNVDFASPDVKHEANAKNIEIHHYNIIYKLVEDLTQKMLESLAPEFEDVDLGILKIKKIFFTEKDSMIIGGKVSESQIEPNVKVKIYRNDAQVSTGEILDIQRGPSKVVAVQVGEDCGATFKGKFKLKEGDELHFFKTVQKKVELQK